MQLLSNDVIRAIGWTLIHSLWQGLVLSLVAGVLILFTRKAKPALRYNIFTLLFFMLVGGAVLTFFYELRPHEAPLVQATTAPAQTETAAMAPYVAATPQQETAVPQIDFTTRFVTYFNEHAPLMVMLWFIVFVARSLWLFGGLVYIQRIRHYKTSVPDVLQLHKLEDLCRRLRLNSKVQLLESALVKVPTALGMLKPVILMPLGMMAQLPPDQVEAVLLHELAHIRRRDFLVNLIQHFAETIFFFNPALLWLSARIREEREHCCDDIAIAVTQSRGGYVQALVSFQEYQLAPRTKYAMAFPGKKKQLLHRVKRILGSNNKTLNMAEKSFLLLCFSLTGILGLVFSQPEKKQTPKQPAVEQVAVVNEKSAVQESKEIDSKEIDDVAPEQTTDPEQAPAAEEPPAVEEEPAAEGPTFPNGALNAAYFYNGVSLEGITEGTTLTFSGDRNGQPFKVRLFKRNQVVYQAEMDPNGELTGFKVDGKEVYKKGQNRQQLAPYTASLQTMKDIYQLPYLPQYQPWQPKQDSVPVLKKGNSVMSGTITTPVGNSQYKITIDNNKATGLTIDGVKVPDDELPSKYNIISSIFRDIERENDNIMKGKLLQEQATLATTQPVTHAPVATPAPNVQIMTPPNARLTVSRPVVAPKPQLTNEAEKIIEDLVKDGLITKKDNLAFQLNKEKFTVNGKTQPEDVTRRYQEKYIKLPTDTYMYLRSGNRTTTHINIGN
jgi:beta-lactamase regulating signal transducer with metallopeptidase domain